MSRHRELGRRAAGLTRAGGTGARSGPPRRAAPADYRAAQRVRLVQVLLLPAVPAMFFVIGAVMRSPSYDRSWYPTIWVPLLLVGESAVALGLSWQWRHRLAATGADDAHQLYQRWPSRWGWLCGHSLFVLNPLLGVLVLLSSSVSPESAWDDIDGAGAATIGAGIVAPLVYLLGAWVYTLYLIGRGLDDGNGPAHSTRRHPVAALGPAGLMAFSIVMAFSVAGHTAWGFFLGLAGLVVSLVATFRLGLAAGYHPPGSPRSRTRWLWITACIIGVVAEGFRIRGLWLRP